MLVQIKEYIHRRADTSPVWRRLFVFIRNIIIHCMSIMPDRAYAKWFYKTYTHKKLNLDNPSLFNEKLWWLKIHNRDPLLTKCSDKHLAREYVKECGFSDILIPQQGVYKMASEIDFTKFSVPVILKPNNGSGGHVFFDPNNCIDFDEKAARKKLDKGLKSSYYLISREWNYKNIPPLIVAETIICDSHGNLPKDFRFFCFNGTPKLLMMDFGVYNDKGQHQFEYPRNIYDMDFNLMPIRWGRDNYKGEVKKPLNFERMKEIATKLSQPFPMVRVDLYNLDGKIYFGEMTFYHGGCCQAISPEEWDRKIGSWIDLNSSKIVLNK